MESCEFDRNCLWHYRVKLLFNVAVYIHLLPWFPVIDVIVLFGGGFFVTLFHGKWDVFRDYDFALWWVFGRDGDDDGFEDFG